MKRIILAACMLSAIMLCAQPYTAQAAFVTQSQVEKGIPASQVPAAVKTTFRSMFPGARNVEWERQTEHGSLFYKAKFTLNGVRQTASFLPDGTFIG
ncbi:MAG TPA: hypothetical protein PL045_11425 [Chitinophagaceae bacterium]|nr:hypothetical protein [Chitinophagaceae bacterium]